MTEKPDLDALEALEAKATRGPWEIENDSESAFVVGPSSNEVIPDPDIVACPAYSDRTHADDRANMALVAALRNAAPFLIKAVREVEALKAALEPFAKEAASWRSFVPDEKRPEIGTDGCTTVFTIGDLRRARALVGKSP